MLSEMLKKYRADNNLTQEEFAAKLFVTRNAVSKWENDNGYPNIDTLKEIAKLLGVTIDELLGEEDLKSIAISGNEKLSKYRKYIANIAVFVLYALVAILIPHFMFVSDPTSVIAYIIFIGPVSFIILGLVTPFLNKNMLHSLIAAGLAITPILIYFEVETSVIMYAWEIIFYILFILAYCFMLKLQKINLKSNKNKVGKWISLSLLIFLSVTYLVLCIMSLITYNESYSAPIYTEPLVFTLIFIIPIIGSTLSYIVFKKKL